VAQDDRLLFDQTLYVDILFFAGGAKGRTDSNGSFGHDGTSNRPKVFCNADDAS
jgi:hypothetical protein